MFSSSLLAGGAANPTQLGDMSPTHRNELIVTSTVVPCVVTVTVSVTVIVILILKRKIVTTWFEKVHTCTAVIVDVFSSETSGECVHPQCYVILTTSYL